ncbi:MAG: hypothetical protein C0501_23795 [Isosphaera sp.]|nr:hypothetical protein [Isosphaera sp.]
MISEPNPDPVDRHPLDEILGLYAAIRAGVADSPGAPLVVPVDDTLAPVEPDGAEALISTAFTALAADAAQVRNAMVEICKTACLIEMGDVLRGGTPRLNPELSARIRDAGERSRPRLTEVRSVTRLADRFTSLPHFFAALEAYRREPARLSDEYREILDRDGLSHPELHAVVCPPLLDRWFRDLRRGLGRAGRKDTTGRRHAVGLPGRPVEYAEGMQRVWNLTSALSGELTVVAHRVGELCRAVVRSHLSQGIRTGSVEPGRGLAETTRRAGAGAVTLLEDLTIHADILRDYRTAQELVLDTAGPT